jgi:hypothetical protein
VSALAGVMHHVLVTLGVIGAYCLFVLAVPRKRCRRCNGWGARQKRRRPAACGRCKGTGRTFRPGARLVHKGAVTAIRHIRERRDDPQAPAGFPEPPKAGYRRPGEEGNAP